MPLDDQINENEEIKEFVKRKLNGEDYSVIRKELLNKGYSKDKVSFLMREIEDLVMESYEVKKFRISPVMIGGFSVAMVGLALLLFAGTGIISFGLLFGGLTLLVAGRTPREGRIERNKWNRRQ